MTEAEFIAWQTRVDKQLTDLQKRVDDLNKLLGKRIDDIGDYAGENRCRYDQFRISTDARLKHLEDDNEAKTTP